MWFYIFVVRWNKLFEGKSQALEVKVNREYSFLSGQFVVKLKRTLATGHERLEVRSERCFQDHTVWSSCFRERDLRDRVMHTHMRFSPRNIWPTISSNKISMQNFFIFFSKTAILGLLEIWRLFFYIEHCNRIIFFNKRAEFIPFLLLFNYPLFKPISSR